MITEMTWGALKELSLDQLTEWIWGHENGWGPIIGIGHTNQGSAATFTYSLDKPTKGELHPLMPDQQQPEGTVVSGYVFILGALTRIALTR